MRVSIVLLGALAVCLVCCARQASADRKWLPEEEGVELQPIQLASGDDLGLSDLISDDSGLSEEYSHIQEAPSSVALDEQVNDSAELDDSADEAIPADWTDKNKQLFGLVERAYTGAYDQINKKLVKQVATDHAAENIEFARGWLQSLKSGTTFFKGDLKAALEQFIELGSISDDIKCNRHTYALLRKNMRGVRGKAVRYDTPYGPIRRVDKIVFKYAMEHAIKCLPRYPALMNQLVDREDLKPVERIMELFGELYSSFTPEQILYSDDGICKKLRNYTPNQKTETEALLRTVARLASNNSEEMQFLNQPKHQNEVKGRMEVDKSKVTNLVDKYVIEPCKLFVREVGLNVVKPAKLDFSVLDKKDIEGVRDEFNSSQFCVGRQRYSFCKIVIKRRSIMIDNLASELLKFSYAGPPQ